MEPRRDLAIHLESWLDRLTLKDAKVIHHWAYAGDGIYRLVLPDGTVHRMTISQ